MKRLFVFLSLVLVNYCLVAQSPQFVLDGDSVKIVDNSAPLSWWTFTDKCGTVNNQSECNAIPECVWLVSVCDNNPNNSTGNACENETTQATCEVLSDAGCVWISGCDRFPGYEHFDLGQKTCQYIDSIESRFMVQNTDLSWTVFKVDTLCAITRSTLNETICSDESYVVPSGDEVHSSEGTYYDTISNNAGCDSIIEINLTVNSADTSVMTSGSTITSNATSASYKWLDCDNSNTPISSETGQSYTPSLSGNYSVEVTENGCTDTSSCVSIVITSINGSLIGDDINIYPNPVEDILTIDLGQQINNTSVSVVDNTGKAVINSHYDNQQVIQLDLADLPPGKYTISIECNSQWRKGFSIQKI